MRNKVEEAVLEDDERAEEEKKNERNICFYERFHRNFFGRIRIYVLSLGNNCLILITKYANGVSIELAVCKMPHFASEICRNRENAEVKEI